MLRGMTAEQFWEWRTYADLEPFDEQRGDLRAAQIVWMLAEINRDARKRSQPYQLKDFVLIFGEHEKKTQTWQEQKALLRQMREDLKPSTPRKRKPRGASAPDTP